MPMEFEMGEVATASFRIMAAALAAVGLLFVVGVGFVLGYVSH